MSLTRLAMKLAIAGFVTKWIFNSRRPRGRSAPSTPSKASRPSGEASAQDEEERGGAAMSAMAETGSDSPNAAERLGATGPAQTADFDSGDNLFQPGASDQPDRIKPGLPDFARGA